MGPPFFVLTRGYTVLIHKGAPGALPLIAMVLLKVLRKTKAREKELRILVLGLDGAGKTTFVRQLNGGDVNTIAPTLGFKIYTFAFKGHKLSIWDIGGQRTIRAYWRNYFELTDGLIWIIDAADQLRIQLCQQELAKLLQEERLAGVPVLVMANKQDVPSALTSAQIKDALRLKEMSNNRHWAIFSCSAKEGTNLIEGINWLVQDISSRVFVKL